METIYYDGLGRKTWSATSSSSTSYYYSSLGQELEEWNSVGSWQIRYVWGASNVNDAILRTRIPQNEWNYLLQDVNHNVTSMMGLNQAIFERYSYDPFGAVTVYSASWSQLGGTLYGMALGFQGERLDSISGLYLFNARWYSTTLMRFVSNDPMLYQAGDNDLYRFVGNNPENRVDPSGLAEPKIFKKIKGSAELEQGTLEWMSEPFRDSNHAESLKNLDEFEKEIGKKLPAMRKALIEEPGPHVEFKLRFTPDPKKCKSKHISFIQVIIQRENEDGRVYPCDRETFGASGQDEYYKSLESKSGSRVDVRQGTKNPFYGAWFNYPDWQQEPGTKGNMGNGPRGIFAEMFDSPTTNVASKKAGIFRAEALVVGLDTGEILGGIQWGFLTTADGQVGTWGTQDRYVRAVPSQAWQDAVNRWNFLQNKPGALGTWLGLKNPYPIGGDTFPITEPGHKCY